MTGAGPDPGALRRLSASCRRMGTAMASDKGAKKVQAEKVRLLESMSEVLDELGLCTNAQLLLMARHRVDAPESA